MILTTHAITGAAIGASVDNLWIIIILSIVLHFSLDNFRHGEYLNQNSKWKDFWRVGVDLSIAATLLIIAIFFNDFNLAQIKYMLLGAFFSMLPDALTLGYWKGNMNWLKKPYDFHVAMHRFPQGSSKRKWNLRNGINDIIFSILALLALFI